MENNSFEKERYVRAQKRVKQLKGFYWHLFWYMVVNIFLLTRIYSKSHSLEDFLEFGHFSTTFFWGIGLVLHWIAVFGKNMVFSKDWEDRKIKEFMNEDKFEH